MATWCRDATVRHSQSGELRPQCKVAAPVFTVLALWDTRSSAARRKDPSPHVGRTAGQYRGPAACICRILVHDSPHPLVDGASARYRAPVRQRHGVLMARQKRRSGAVRQLARTAGRLHVCAAATDDYRVPDPLDGGFPFAPFPASPSSAAARTWPRHMVRNLPLLALLRLRWMREIVTPPEVLSSTSTVLSPHAHGGSEPAENESHSSASAAPTLHSHPRP